jgi:hypothetical protein
MPPTSRLLPRCAEIARIVNAAANVPIGRQNPFEARFFTLRRLGN